MTIDELITKFAELGFSNLSYCLILNRDKYEEKKIIEVWTNAYKKRKIQRGEK